MFKLLKIENASMNVPEPVFYDAAAGEAVSIGEALQLTNGKLTKCGATTKPEFISMGEKGATDEKRSLAACRVTPAMLWEVPVTAIPSALKPGDKVTLNSDGMQVTATTSSGVITVEDVGAAAAAGDKITVRIV